MDITEVLHKLEKHEAECALRMQIINQRLEQHDASFEKIEKYLVGVFASMGTLLVFALRILELAR